MRTLPVTLFASLLLSPLCFAQARWDAAPGQQTNGTFWRVHWYERGLQHGNPAYEQRFRVNSPEVVLHPVFGKRVEARENGLMLILAEEDLGLLTGAELYLEAWGGHPGTANKRVTVNGRSTYYLPRVGTEDLNCTYHYPALGLRIDDLVNGYSAFQFALDRGKTFWGHMLVDNACLRVALTNGHPDLARAGLDAFQAKVKATAWAERWELALDLPESKLAAIESVDFQGYCFGYDENGDSRCTDWHGFTKDRKPVALLGTATTAPFSVAWDTTMLPAQKGVAVRAVIHFKGQTNLAYVTGATCGLQILERPGRRVTLYASHDLPKGFWSRANQKKQCIIYLDVNPRLIERAELHVNAWTGGPGEVKEYFLLNGRHFPVADGAKHELIYSRLPVDPGILRQGANIIELRSDTEHHGIEILLPGPCLMVRSRPEAGQ